MKVNYQNIRKKLNPLYRMDLCSCITIFCISIYFKQNKYKNKLHVLQFFCSKNWYLIWTMYFKINNENYFSEKKQLRLKK